MGKEWEDHKYIKKVTTKSGKVRYVYSSKDKVDRVNKGILDFGKSIGDVILSAGKYKMAQKDYTSARDTHVRSAERELDSKATIAMARGKQLLSTMLHTS